MKEDPWEAAGKATTTEELERKVGKEEAFGASEVTFLLPSIHSGRDRAKKFYEIEFSRHWQFVPPPPKEVHVRFLQKKRHRRVIFDPSFDALLHFNLSSLLG